MFPRRRRQPLRQAARGAAPAAAPQGGGRGNALPTYVIPDGVVHAGKNTITVRIQNQRNEGGFTGTPDVMYLEGAGNSRTSAGGHVEIPRRAPDECRSAVYEAGPARRARRIHGRGGPGGAAGAALPAVAPQAPDLVVRLSVIPGQLKYDKAELNVAPGQLVEVVFTNPDVMQHNFVLGAPGSLNAIGEAGDKLATSPSGLSQGYVPDMPQVLFSTKLLDPGQTVTFQFRAPANCRSVPVTFVPSPRTGAR